MAKTTRSRGGLRRIAVRVSDDIIERVDRYAASLAADNAGAIYNRTDAVKILLLRGLDRAEGLSRRAK